MIELSDEQRQCKAAVCAWDSDPESNQVFRIDGYAGCGKTSTVKQTVAELEGLTLYATFTGKAALVLQQNGCEASTIHKLIYTPFNSSDRETVESKTQELKDTIAELVAECSGDDHADAVEAADNHPSVKKLKKEIAQLNASSQTPVFRLNLDSPIREASRVVIDEHSMVGKSLATDLLSFGVPILAQGDPGQLPPVADEGFFNKGQADFTLTQIHRQAAGSPIIQLATQARCGERLAFGTYGDSAVVSSITPEQALAADQILCGRNETRHVNNARMRALKGFSGEMPMPGEKLVCLRNNHEKGLLNGSLWTVIRCNRYGKYQLSLTVRPEEGGPSITVKAHSQYFTQYGRTEMVPPVVPKEKAWYKQIMEDERSIGFALRDAESFCYGYVLTVHKSQGSQWPNVLVIDESGAFKEDAKKHLYTAITRAMTSVIVSRP